MLTQSLLSFLFDLHVLLGGILDDLVEGFRNLHVEGLRGGRSRHTNGHVHDIHEEGDVTACEGATSCGVVIVE